MMSTRRSLLVIGCLMVALGLVGVGEARAQATASFAEPPPGAMVRTYSVDESKTVDIPVELIVAGMVNVPLVITVSGEYADAWSFYGAGVNVSDNGAMLTLAVSPGQRRAIITAASIADGNGDNELATLTIGDDADVGPGDPVIVNGHAQANALVIDDQRPEVGFKAEEATVLEGTKGEVEITTNFGPEFQHNTGSSVRVMEMSSGGESKVQLLAGDEARADATYSYDADGRLVISLTGSKDDINFMVQAQDDMDGSDEEVTIMLTRPSGGVRLDEMTMMTLKLVDDDEDAPKREDDESDEDGEATPTPALPLFGAIALAGALATAGRRRMRQLRAARERKLLV